MKKNKPKGNPNLRIQLANEAARLMYEEQVEQYYDAKWLAVKRLFKQGSNRKWRPQDLPSNGDIVEAIKKLADLYEGDSRADRLFAMRLLALEIMEALADFFPRLIGSVSTGHVRKGSDIDLHVFTDDVELLERRLNDLNYCYEKNRVAIRKGHNVVEYLHIYLDCEYPVELSVYGCNERRVRGRSSTDGKPIIRIKAQTLQDMIIREHSEHWAALLNGE